MNEEEWLACTDPTPMLGFLRSKLGDRKLWLFFCACCRAVWHLLDATQKRAIEVAERYADGLEDNQRLETVQREISPGPYFTGTQRAAAVLGAVCGNASANIEAANLACGEAIREAIDHGKSCIPLETMNGIRRIQADQLRCILGSIPFRSISLDPRWRTSTAIDLARAIYDERAVSRMPILADALMDAGCDSDEIISHCRQPGEHVRGCWVVDLLLAKT